MRNQRNRLLAAPLLALVVLVALAGPASASGDSVGACMAEHLEAHGELDSHLLHDEAVQDELEKCFEAPSPILPELNEIIWGGGAFLILFVLMVKKGFPAVQGAMDARANRIRSDLDEADRAKLEAQSVKSDYEARLADAKAEASRLIDEARGDAEKVRADLVARAEADAAGIRERAAAESDAAKAQAIADLRAEVASIALGAAERVVQSSLDAEVQGNLIDAYIDEVAGADG
ncbi:MAG: F0F1 ATP synthase subunit B [Acidimicrobiales bacterium]|mgnify:FL=1|jgi:F-type H+-transporting ATPase subunit b|nr:F0F1 ATP synthase subunit B [Acidimicrobiales bacterium]MDP6649855.1 F0F1 ATP synthase subunit B [Acidimicrobiales bacterium]MDP6760755.1 F0F1 ATP synthase subunit B [Acidimicrobiales bacterium]|tara:strand:+ start:6485 stop:7183 length:699 start_codon:yes stop_codon:yes gene_type:complete